ncbi:hypothetical protein VaNZ11_008372, partial [Volvox africanus]
MSSVEKSRTNQRGSQAYCSPSKSKAGTTTSQATCRSKVAQYGKDDGSGGGSSGTSHRRPTATAGPAAASTAVTTTASCRTAPYTHSSTPTAVRSRTIGSISWQGGQEPAAGGDGVDGCFDDSLGSDVEQSYTSVSRAAVERIRLRRILEGGIDGASAVTAVAVEDPAGPAQTEQDSTCEVAAASIIVMCQASGICDVSMRGVTRLPPSLYKFFRAEGGLVSELQVQGNRLSAAPPLELLPSLTRMDISANLLSSVPDSLGKLLKLRALDMSRNVKLIALPDSLCDLTGLTSLDLSHNALQCLPLTMGRLNRLVEMRLDSNNLSYLPPECVGLPSLTALHVSYNRLTALPSELGGASSLTGIFVNHNKLTALPATLGQLRQRLADLHLHNNELTVLPRELGLLVALTRITTGCNPLVHPPPDVARRGLAAVREYLLADWPETEQGTERPVQEGDGGGDDEVASPGQEQVPEGNGAGGSGGEPRMGVSAGRRRRLVLSAACKSCADKEDRIEELGQLLREAGERTERYERQLEQSQEKLRRQAQDLSVHAQRSVQLDAEISRLNRQLAAAASAPTLGRRPAAGGGSSGCERRTEEVEEHLRRELTAARSAAEVAGAAAEAAERDVRKLRRDLERREQEVAAHRERGEQLSASLGQERERCIAAVSAATDAAQKLEELQVAAKERDELRKKLETSKKANQDAWKAAHVAREGQLSAEATADVTQGKLVAAEAASRRLAQQLQEEKAAAGRAAAEAESRQMQLQTELTRLQADLAALMAERTVLHDLAHSKVPATGRADGSSIGTSYTAGPSPQTATAFGDE